jgi:heptaprenylglyceryl phosphate synthase
MIMLPLSTLARRLREDAIKVFSINADMILIGGSAAMNERQVLRGDVPR